MNLKGNKKTLVGQFDLGMQLKSNLQDEKPTGNKGWPQMLAFVTTAVRLLGEKEQLEVGTERQLELRSSAGRKIKGRYRFYVLT